MASRVANIGERGARRRRTIGMVWAVIAVVATIALATSDAPRSWRLLLVVPFGLAANGFLQAREKTCVLLGALGKRETPDGASYEAVPAAENAIVRRQVASQLARNAVIAVALTVLAWWI